MSGTPVQRKAFGISPIWTLPILALAICVWLLYQSFQNAGINITIYFDDASGITEGKTQVVSMGLPIGLVKKVEAELESGRIKTTVEMDKNTESILAEDTIFWVVKPEVSAAKISGLDTILSGSYIGIQPGNSHTQATTFTGLSSPPPISVTTPGLHFFLEADALQSIQAGSGIYYKNIQIGSVQSYGLQQNIKNNAAILISCFIKEQYAHLVKPESHFTNASGISISGKLTNLKFRMESLSSLIMGGIHLETPDEAMDNTPVVSGHTFKLYADLEEANFILPMTLTLASGEGIVEGVTKVIYRGLEAGYVNKIDFSEEGSGTVYAHILLDERAEIILKKGTKFWLAGPEISAGGIKNLSTLVSGPYITFSPGKGEYTDHFEILPEAPALKPLRPGKSFTLISSQPSTLAIGSPVLYKGVQVGEVIDLHLKPNDSNLIYTIFIYQHYLNFLSSHSVFWNNSGIKFKASLKGVEFESSTLSSIIHGGVSFLTPELITNTPIATPQEGDQFTLFEGRREAFKNDPQLRPQGTHFQIISKERNSISVDSPILYKEYKIGRVLDYQLDSDHILFDCLIEPEYEQYLQSNSLFYNVSGIKVSGGLSGISFEAGSLETMFTGGIGLYTPPNSSPTKFKKKYIYSLYENLEEAKTRNHTELQIIFRNVSNLKIGSLVKYHGIEVGKVTAMDINRLPEVNVTIKVAQNMEKYFRTGTQIWLETSEIALPKIRNLDTVVFGPYITFEPGEGKPHRNFIALPSPPAEKPVKSTTGLDLILKSKTLGSLSTGAPVYYRQVQVGRITGYELDTTFKNVLIYVHINNKYSPIIRENTKFWNASGTTIEGGIISGIKFRAESFESIIKGGIALATPEDLQETGNKVSDGHSFTLHDDYKPEWLDWTPDIIVLEREQKKMLLLQ